MKYLVTRTSVWGDESPCDGAVRKQVVRVDRRSVDDPRKIPANKGNDGDWYIRGENHRVENGNICRDMGFNHVWHVEIDDILKFIKEHGQCVVDVGFDGTPSIEIYDEHRE